jgi:hypothetical protein
MFRVAYRSSSGALTVFAASGLHTHVETGRCQGIPCSLLTTLTGNGRDLLKVLFLHLNINGMPMPITIDYNIKWHLEPFISWNLSILQCLKIQKLRKMMEEVQKSNCTKCDTPLSEPIK